MSFTNPKPGGYVTGEKLPSAHVNTVWGNVEKAVDGTAGGTYAGSLNFSNLQTTTTTTANIGTAVVTTATITNLTIPAPNTVNLGSRTYARATQTTPYFDSASFWYGSGGFFPRLIDLGLSGSNVTWPIAVPSGSTLYSCLMYVTPAGGHGVVPASPPEWTIYKMPISTGAAGVASVATQVDTVIGSTGAYETRHAISKTGMAEVIDNSSYFYYLIFTSEAGVGGVTGLKVEFPVFGFTTTAIDPGAS